MKLFSCGHNLWTEATFLTQTEAAALTGRWKHWQFCAALFVCLGLKIIFYTVLFLLDTSDFFTHSNIPSHGFFISVFLHGSYSPRTPLLSIALTARAQWYLCVLNWFDTQISWMSLCNRVRRLSLILLISLFFVATFFFVVFFPSLSDWILFSQSRGSCVGMIATEQDSEHTAHFFFSGWRRKPWWNEMSGLPLSSVTFQLHVQ